MDFHLNNLALKIILILLFDVAFIKTIVAHNVVGSAKNKIKKDDKMCKKQMELLLEGYQTKELWTLKVFDSWGKSQSGLFSGNLVNFGHYDQCLQIQHEFKDPLDGIYQGQHCMIFFRDSPEVIDKNLTIQDLILPQMIHIDLMRQYINVFNARMGNSLCVPSVCSSRMVRLIADRMLAQNSMKTTTDYNQEVFCNTINILEMRSIDMFAA